MALIRHGRIAKDLGLVEDAEGLADLYKHADVRTSLDVGSR